MKKKEVSKTDCIETILGGERTWYGWFNLCQSTVGVATRGGRHGQEVLCVGRFARGDTNTVEGLYVEILRDRYPCPPMMGDDDDAYDDDDPNSPLDCVIHYL